MPKQVFTIGYEGVTVDALVQTLKNAGIQILLDVRAVPLSRKPGFSKNKLAAKLKESGIDYLGLKGLGTPPEGRDAARKGRCDEMRNIFAIHMQTDAAQADLKTAIEIAGARLACLLCFEHLPDCCHRMVVAEDMAKQGYEIIHLDPYPAHLFPAK